MENERERETKTKNKQINLILCHLKEEMYRKGETESLRQRQKMKPKIMEERAQRSQYTHRDRSVHIERA